MFSRSLCSVNEIAPVRVVVNRTQSRGYLCYLCLHSKWTGFAMAPFSQINFQPGWKFNKQKLSGRFVPLFVLDGASSPGSPPVSI